MDQHLIAQRAHNAELGFNTTRMTFLMGNAASIAITCFAHLNSQTQLALTAFVIILNIASFLSFDTELKIFAALSKDGGDENSVFANGSKQTPWGAFRIFCLVICIVAAVTQVMAINA